MKNEGTLPIRDTVIYLEQPETGSERLNFGTLTVRSYTAAEAQAGQLKVELEIKNALTGETRTVDGGSGSVVNVALPALQENEYISRVIVTPMGTDGLHEGEYAPQNAISISYTAKNWETDFWPDGTAIPANRASLVNMSWHMDY